MRHTRTNSGADAGRQQVSPESQLSHMTPPVPHWEVLDPVAQLEPVQHPVQQLPPRHRPNTPDTEQLVSSAATTQLPPLHRRQVPQVVQAPPLEPHAESVTEGAHAPLPFTQVVQHVPFKHRPPEQLMPFNEVSATHTPPEQVSQGPHATQAAPPLPHALTLSPARHDDPSQHPPQHAPSRHSASAQVWHSAPPLPQSPLVLPV